MKKKNAFTLAEVLITLTIIGVIAALTIPNLMSKYQKHVWVTKLHKCYNKIITGNTLIVQNAIELPYYGEDRNEFDERVKILEETFEQGSGGIACGEHLNKGCKYTNYKTRKNLDKKLDGTADNWSRTSRDGFLFANQYGFSYPDGSVITMMFNTFNAYWYDIAGKNLLFSFAVDVNGAQGPNQIGRDIFVFERPNNSYTIRPYGIDNPSDCEKGKEGYTCAARIIKDGWKMNY